MTTFKFTQGQIEEMREFFGREKQMVQEANRSDTIKHQLKDYLITKAGFLDILNELAFDQVKEKNYINRVESLTSLNDLNTKNAEETFEFVAVKGNLVFRVEMTNTLTYYRDEINSIVEITLTNYGDKDYTNSEYDMIDDPSKVYPSTKLLEITGRVLKDYQRRFDMKGMVAEDDNEEEEEDENSEIVLYGSKYGDKAINEKEMGYLKEVDKRIKKGEYERAQKIMEKLSELNKQNK